MERTEVWLLPRAGGGADDVHAATWDWPGHFSLALQPSLASMPDVPAILPLLTRECESTALERPPRTPISAAGAPHRPQLLQVESYKDNHAFVQRCWLPLLQPAAAAAAAVATVSAPAPVG